MFQDRFNFSNARNYRGSIFKFFNQVADVQGGWNTILPRSREDFVQFISQSSEFLSCWCGKLCRLLVYTTQGMDVLEPFVWVGSTKVACLGLIELTLCIGNKSWDLATKKSVICLISSCESELPRFDLVLDIWGYPFLIAWMHPYSSSWSTSVQQTPNNKVESLHSIIDLNGIWNSLPVFHVNFQPKNSEIIRLQEPNSSNGRLNVLLLYEWNKE